LAETELARRARPGQEKRETVLLALKEQTNIVG
jgi:hypothetical protein